MIIDCHCHAGKGDGFRGPWDTEAQIEPYLKRAQAVGITKTVVFPAFNSNYAAANARLFKIVQSYSDRLIGFGAINPRQDRGRAELVIRRAVEDYGFRGLKIHGHDSFPNREVLDVARSYQLPILLDVVNRLAAVEMIAPQYPELNFIIPHFGGFRDDWMTYIQMIDQLQRLPNVYADTSGLRYWDILPLAIRRAGPHKILFGSDGPYLHPAAELYKIKLLNLPPEQERLITSRNILRLLKLITTTSFLTPNYRFA